MKYHFWTKINKKQKEEGNIKVKKWAPERIYCLCSKHIVINESEHYFVRGQNMVVVKCPLQLWTTLC